MLATLLGFGMLSAAAQVTPTPSPQDHATLLFSRLPQRIATGTLLLADVPRVFPSADKTYKPRV